MSNHSIKLFNYNTWANKTLLNHLMQLPSELCHENIKSVFPSIFDTLMHIYIVDYGWHSLLTRKYTSDDYEAIRSTIARLTEEVKALNLQDFGKKQDLLSKSYYDFVSTTDMEQTVIYSTLSMQHSEVIQHVVNHGTYHRGNITAMLRQLDHAGVPTDYSMYLYQSMK